MEIFSVAPEIWRFDEPLIQDLKAGRISYENFAKILSQSPDMPFEIRDGRLIHITLAEMEKHIATYIATNKTLLHNSGGISGPILIHYKDIFFQVFPEIKEMTEAVIKKAEAEKCPSCQIGKQMGPVIEEIGMLRDGRDMSAFQVAFKGSPFLKFTMMWLRNEKFEVADADIPIPPFFKKKTVGVLPEATVDEHGLPLLEGCLECVHKHLSDAYELAIEILQGYTPEKGYRHFDRLVGNLVSAEIEAMKVNPELSMKIRIFRQKITGQVKDAPKPSAGN